MVREEFIVMSKKKGMFSWLGIGRQQEEVAEDVNENIVEAAELSEEIVVPAEEVNQEIAAEPIEETVDKLLRIGRHS